MSQLVQVHAARVVAGRSDERRETQSAFVAVFEAVFGAAFCAAKQAGRPRSGGPRRGLVAGVVGEGAQLGGGGLQPARGQEKADRVAQRVGERTNRVVQLGLGLVR